MCHVAPRDHEIRNLLQDDATTLRVYETSHTAGPLTFELLTATQLDHEDLQDCMNLIEQTSGDDYRASSIGWNPRKKKAEMLEEGMMYILIKQCDAAPTSTQAEYSVSHPIITMNEIQEPPRGSNIRILGFISFMFTKDDPPYEERDVVYVYEIHLAEALRGHGLGSKLLEFVESAARHCSISKTMLTVFTANESARSLYTRLGYGKDECSPKDRVMRRKVVKADYIIMSKEMV